MSVHDPRITAHVGGTAMACLEGVLVASSYVQPRRAQVGAGSTAIRREPRARAEQVDQLLFGERFEILEDSCPGWVFGQAARDGYVGFVDIDALTDVGPAPSHWVRALRTFAFAAPSIKAAPVACLSMNALVSVQAVEQGLAKIVGSGWAPLDHLSVLGDWDGDPAGVAERYLGTPYLWGGRDSLGLDCSGLVQQALYACGRSAPRDSDLQYELGCAVAPVHDRADLQRGDLVFWRGHVGMMLDDRTLLHANAHHMAVAREPLDQATVRIGATKTGQPIGFRRLHLF